MVEPEGGAAAAALVAHAEGLARSFYGLLTTGQLALMRQTLLR